MCAHLVSVTLAKCKGEHHNTSIVLSLQLQVMRKMDYIDPLVQLHAFRRFVVLGQLVMSHKYTLQSIT